MMNVMYATGWSFIFLYGLHLLSIVIFVFGMAFLLLWAFKHLSEHALWQWGWLLLVLGTIACLLTLPAWPIFATGGMMGRWNSGGTAVPWSMPMMWWNGTAASQNAASTSSAQ